MRVEHPDTAAGGRAGGGAPGFDLTLRIGASYIGSMRPETRRNRNPQLMEHAFT
jgi:hypothetical protein